MNRTGTPPLAIVLATILEVPSIGELGTY